MRGQRLLRGLRYLFWLAPLPLLWLAFRQVPFRAVGEILSRLSLGNILGLVLLNAGIFLLFTSRWWWILRAEGYRIPFLSLVGYRLAGFGVAYFIPGPQFGGEPLQVYLVRSRHGVPAAASIAAVSLDKLLELQSNFAFLIFGFAVILRAGLLGNWLDLPAQVLLAGLLLLPAGYLLALRLRARPLSALAGLLLAAFPRSKFVRKLSVEIASAEAQVAGFLKHKPRALIVALLLSMLIWAAMLVEYWLSLRFLGLRLDLFQAVTLLTAARVAFLMPVPAGLGTLEAAQVMAALALGLPPAYGASLSLLIRARDISFAGLGLYRLASLAHPRPAKSLSSTLIE